MYLRHFADSSEQLFCYDKANDRSFLTSTKAIAQERYFYEIPHDAFAEFEVPLNAIEDILSIAEGNWAPLHEALISEADRGHFQTDLVLAYAPFLALQWMRTKTYRDMMRETMKLSAQSIVDDLLELNFPESKGKVRVVPNETAVSAMHSQRMFSEADKLSQAMESHLWIVGINETKEPFYTSDHPVVRNANQQKNDRKLTGALDPGIEFAFPLDSRHVLLILERTHFSEWQELDNKSVALSVEQVRKYNSLQVMRSCQRVFCPGDIFELARSVCARHPEIRNPDRPRIRIESTPVIKAKNKARSYRFLTAIE